MTGAHGGEPSPGERCRGQSRAPRVQGLQSRPGLLEPPARARPLEAPASGPGARARIGPARPKGKEKPPPGKRPLWRRVLKWAGIAALAWILISFLAFEISSQIQKWKLVDMGNTLHGNPFLAVSPQTILVIGTDMRSGQFAGPDEAASKSCLDAAGSGKAPPSHCTPTDRTR